MRLLVSGRGETATYREERGPDGSRFAAWRDGLRQRNLERFGLDVSGDPATVANERRRLRNARKQERSS